MQFLGARLLNYAKTRHFFAKYLQGIFKGSTFPSLSLLRVISLAVKDITLKSLYVVLCWLII